MGLSFNVRLILICLHVGSRECVLSTKKINYINIRQWMSPKWQAICSYLKSDTPEWSLDGCCIFWPIWLVGPLRGCSDGWSYIWIHKCSIFCLKKSCSILFCRKRWHLRYTWVHECRERIGTCRRRDTIQFGWNFCRENFWLCCLEMF